MYRTDAHEDRSLLLSGYERKLIAYRRDNGEVAWVFKDDGGYDFYVDFDVHGGRVFVAVGNSIVCLDYKTGNVIGATPLPSDILRLIIDEERIYAFGSDHLYCVDLAGRLVWQRPQEIYTSSKMPTFGFPGNIVHGFRDSG
jgi:outer membrane protein assembly factor BamB